MQQRHMRGVVDELQRGVPRARKACVAQGMPGVRGLPPWPFVQRSHDWPPCRSAEPSQSQLRPLADRARGAASDRDEVHVTFSPVTAPLLLFFCPPDHTIHENACGRELTPASTAWRTLVREVAADKLQHDGASDRLISVHGVAAVRQRGPVDADAAHAAHAREWALGDGRQGDTVLVGQVDGLAEEGEGHGAEGELEEKAREGRRQETK